jgi:hypothetical protein
LLVHRYGRGVGCRGRCCCVAAVGGWF